MAWITPTEEQMREAEAQLPAALERLGQLHGIAAVGFHHVLDDPTNAKTLEAIWQWRRWNSTRDTAWRDVALLLIASGQPVARVCKELRLGRTALQRYALTTRFAYLVEEATESVPSGEAI